VPAYLVYLSGFAVVAVWWHFQRRLGPRAWLGWWWLGLLLHLNLPAALAEKLLYAAHLPYAALTAPAILPASRWLGSILLFRVLADLTRWGRPRKPLHYVLAAGFIASLLLAPWLGSGKRSMLALFGPVLFGGSSYWAIALLALPWLWSFRWREGMRARWLMVVAVTAVVSLLLVTNSEFTGGQRLSGEIFLGWSSSGNARSAWTSGQGGLRVFATQVPDLCGLYALCFLLGLSSLARLTPRRVSRRLVFSHVLAAVPPVTLALVFVILLTTAYLATYRSEIAGRALEREAERLGEAVRPESAPLQGAALSPFLAAGPERIFLVGQDRASSYALGVPFAGPQRDSLLAIADSLRRTPLVLARGTLYLHAHVDTVRSGRPLALAALEPVDSLLMQRVSTVVGAPARLHPRFAVRGNGSFSSNAGDAANAPASIGPATRERWQLPSGLLVRCLWWNGRGWELVSVPLMSSATLAEPILALGRSVKGGTSFGFLLLMLLWLVGLLLLALMWWGIRVALDMARSLGRTTAALTRATRSVAAGDFSHRIQIQGRDELWSVAESFNDMAGKLETMREIERRALRLEKELEIARQVQQSLFPRELPQRAGWQLAAACRPAREVGGDYYDLFARQDEIVFALGDVSGKGLGPSLLMSNVQATVRSRLRRRETPLPSLFEELNEQLLESASPGMFVTLFVGIVDAKTGRLRYVNGGHNAPLLCPSPSGDPEPLTEGGLIVGVLPGTRWQETEVLLPRGGTLFVYSDGITEAVNEAGEMYEESRLLDLLRASPRLESPELLASAFDSVDRFRGHAEQADDMSVVVVGRQPG